MEPSLKNAYVQRDRAREHFGDLEVLAERICAEEGKAIVTEVKLEVNLKVNPPVLYKDLYKVVKRGDTPIPTRCSVLAGEVINCLRSALDYLVANLAALDSPTLETRPQFPVESTQEGFDGKRGTYLRGVNEPHVAFIESLQPCNGCKWTKHLARLSNLHKHNDLLPVQHDILYFIHLEPIESTEPNTSPYKVNMEFQPTLYVGLDDGLPLIETLKEIESQVSQTLDAFDPEFK